MKIYRVTYALLGLLLVSYVVSLSIQAHDPRQIKSRAQISERERRESARKRQEKMRNQYPSVDYFEKDDVVPSAKRASLAASKKRYNNRSEISKSLNPPDAEIASRPDNLFDFPAFPFERSNVVVLVEILDAQAHMSEDKGSVFSEFTARVNTIFKSDLGEKIQNQTITVERPGGWIVYPNGQKLLYRIMDCGMPQVGGRYVLFLNAIFGSENLRILTGYELQTDRVVPLDLGRQFEIYNGSDQASFLESLQQSKSSITNHEVAVNSLH